MASMAAERSTPTVPWLPARIVVAPRYISSPALRLPIGTTGTPACIAMWKAPFLKGPGAGDLSPPQRYARGEAADMPASPAGLRAMSSTPGRGRERNWATGHP
jgi:hypothetical protein